MPYVPPGEETVAVEGDGRVDAPDRGRMPRGEQPRENAPASRRHIVVIDGAPDVRALLRDLLEGEGYRVSTFCDLPPPAELARRTPDLVILELLFCGEHDAWAEIAALRIHRRLRTVPMIICTGASDIIQERGLDLMTRDVGVVIKPFDIEPLLEEVSRRLQGPPATAWASEGETPAS